MQQQLFKGRDRRRKGWFWLDNDYLNGYARFFGAIGTAIYVSLCRHANNDSQECFPAIKTIAEENNVGESTVKQFIKIFEKYHILEVKREKDPTTKRWIGNVYRLLDKEEWIKPETPLKKKRQKKSQSQSIDVDSQGQSLSKPEPESAKSQSQSIDHKETKYINKTYINKATHSVAGLNELIELFKEVNPSYERIFSNKSQRSALKRLVKKFGRKETEVIINTAVQVFGEKYAPQITTPYELEQKLGKLIAFVKSKKSSNQIIGIAL